MRRVRLETGMGEEMLRAAICDLTRHERQVHMSEHRHSARGFGIWHLAFGMDRQNASWVDRAD